jgi:hypothetical protein
MQGNWRSGGPWLRWRDGAATGLIVPTRHTQQRSHVMMSQGSTAKRRPVVATTMLTNPEAIP